jgi:hypothetical protein
MPEACAAEQPLTGGTTNRGQVFRVGDTVRRPRRPTSPATHALLRHLADVGFGGAPRARGFDDRGREVVGFVEGHVPHGLPFRLTDPQLTSATALVRAYHDASATFPLRTSGEVVCHGDLGPHNTVFRGDTAVAIIDWDTGVHGGSRLDDFAHAVWCFADLTEAAVPLEEQARRVRLMCDGYPGMTPPAVVAELTARFHRARAWHAQAGRAGGVVVFDRLLAWMGAHGTLLTAPPAAGRPGTPEIPVPPEEPV